MVYAPPVRNARVERNEARMKREAVAEAQRVRAEVAKWGGGNFGCCLDCDVQPDLDLLEAWGLEGYALDGAAFPRQMIFRPL